MSVRGKAGQRHQGAELMKTRPRIPWHQQEGHRPDWVDELIDDNQVCMEKTDVGLCGWTLPCTRHPRGK